MNIKENIKNNNTGFFSFFKKNIAILSITILLVIAGIFSYIQFSPGVVLAQNPASPSANELLLDQTLKIKSTTGTLGEVKLFATVDDSLLKKLRAAEGSDSVSEATTTKGQYAPIVIGFAEAQMMRDEKLFSNIGDELSDLFGMNVSVAGVLSKTNTLVDDMHFVDAKTYEQNIGSANNVFVLPLDGMPKIFYYLPVGFNQTTAPKLVLKEGSLEQYSVQSLGAVTYTPVMIGFSEAQMMLEEGLFTAVGDTIRGFFGQDVVIVGILEKTGTAIDMMHFIPLTQEQMLRKVE